METTNTTTTLNPVKTLEAATAHPVTTDKQNAVHAISQWLNRGDELDRCCACRSLGVLADHNSVAILADHLRDEDIDVCVDAAEALGHIGDTSAVAPLLESLHNDPDSDVKSMVVKALGKLGGKRVISQLLELAITPPVDNEWDDGDAWDSNWDIQLEAIRALGQLRVSAAVKPFIGLLDDEECQADKSDVFNSLAHIGGAGEQLLITHLREDTTRERRRAARALGLSCSAIGARALGRALQDPEAEVRAAAADALAAGGHDCYLSALLILLHDPSDEVRGAALRAVDKLTSTDPSTTKSSPIELEKLLPLLDDESPQVRAALLKILHGRLTDNLSKRAQSRILELVEDINPIVAAAACPLAVILNHPRTEQTLLSLTMNSQGETAVRQQAILALGQRGNPSASVLKALTETLETEETVITFAALQALLALHTQADTPNKESNSENKTDKTQTTPFEIILAALCGEINSPVILKPEHTGSEPPIEEPAIDETTNDSVKENTTEEPGVLKSDNDSAESISPVSTLDSIALSNVELEQQKKTSVALDPDEIPELPAAEMETFQSYFDILEQQKYDRKKFTRNTTINITAQARRMSARILGECSQPKVVTALAQAIHDEDPEIQREVIESLARMEPATPGISEILGPLTSFLHLGNIDLRVVCARALGALGNLDTLSSLTEYLEDESLLVRSQVVVSIGQLLKSYATVSNNKPNSLPVANKRAREAAANVELALRSLVKRLADSDVGVRKTTALTISKLNHLISSAELREDIIQHLIDAGFYGAGEQARDMGAALRRLDSTAAGTRLILLLDDLPSSIERRFAMEMLEEVFKSSTNKNAHLL